MTFPKLRDELAHVVGTAQQNHFRGGFVAPPPKKKEDTVKDVFFKVGMTRFELATPRPPDVYATRLRHIPNNVLIPCFK